MIRYLILVYLLFLLSCSKDQADENLMSGATWKVSYFFAEKEETAVYASFYFMFNEDGTLMAHEGNRLTVGRWSETNDRFSIVFDSHALLMQLKGDWRIEERTSSVLKLKEAQAALPRILHLLRE